MLPTWLALLTLGQTAPLDNLDFRAGSLRGWEGQGFYLTVGRPEGPGIRHGVCSSDAGSRTKKGMLRYVLTVPAGAGMLQFQAFAAVAAGVEPDHRLDIILAGADNRPIARKVRSASGWSGAPSLLPRWQARPRSYCWDVATHVGRTLQIVLIDQDDRPGHYVYATDFKFVAAQQFFDHDFARTMTELQEKHSLAQFTRFDSKRFTAISNATEEFTIERLNNCEIFYDHFLAHFREKGFTLHPPPQRLMIAIFDAPAGLEAYLGQKLPPSIAGLYHPTTNRLLLYDLSENRAMLANKQHALKYGDKIRNNFDRSRFIGAIERQATDFSKDANLSTTMHEAAHQIAFNCGLLNRAGDGPCWLVEGMATYCEATDQGDWTALGGPNPLRIVDLAGAKGSYLTLEELVQNDRWRKTPKVLLGYSQSWALFRMLMEERMPQLKAYLQTIATRQAPEHRLTDFRAVFGADLAALEGRYHAYMGDLIVRYPPPKAR
jgi:hypothetical protein